MRYFLLLSALPLLFSGCSPLKSSPGEEKHQLELTLHQLQTDLDDVRHDLHCHKSEVAILDGKIRYQENLFLQQQGTISLEELNERSSELQLKFTQLQKEQESSLKDLRKISLFSDQVKLALEQWKQKMEVLEKNQTLFLEKIEGLRELKNQLSSLTGKGEARTYKVQSGDSLERISKRYKIPIESLKSINHLESDLIVVGQELQLP